MNEVVTARSERIADLVRLSIGVRRPGHAEPIWRCRHLPLHRLHGSAEQVQRLVANLCADMWGELADRAMVQVAFESLDDRVLWAHHASPYQVVPRGAPAHGAAAA